MKDLKRYIYPSIVIFLVVFFGWAYIVFVQEDVDPKVVEEDNQLLVEYVRMIEKIEGLRLKTDVLDSDLYLSLTDEYEEDVIEVGIGRVNPFRPL